MSGVKAPLYVCPQAQGQVYAPRTRRSNFVGGADYAQKDAPRTPRCTLVGGVEHAQKLNCGVLNYEAVDDLAFISSARW